MGETWERRKNAYRILVGKVSVRSARSKSEDNIQMDLRNRMEWYRLDSSDSG
jgi:hypothetical protein